MSTNLNYHPRRLIIVMNNILSGFESAKHFPNCLNDTCKFFANIRYNPLHSAVQNAKFCKII